MPAVVNDPLGALGINIETLKTRFMIVLGQVRVLIDNKQRFEGLQTQVNNALEGFKSALNTPGLETEKKKYLDEVAAELHAVRERVTSSLTDLERELRTVTEDMIGTNLGAILSLTAQFVNDAHELKDRYWQLRDALRTTPSTVKDVLNNLLRLKEVEATVGTTEERLKSLERTFQTSRVELETEWEKIRQVLITAIAGAAKYSRKEKDSRGS